MPDESAAIVDPIAYIRAKFEKYPNVRYEEGKDWIRYEPDSESGFPVTLWVGDGEFVVSYDDWHEHFRQVAEALDCFAFGLSDMCRLKIISRGGWPHKWIAESYESGNWLPYGTTGRLLFAFWRAPVVEYRQNALIKVVEAQGDQ